MTDHRVVYIGSRQVIGHGVGGYGYYHPTEGYNSFYPTARGAPSYTSRRGYYPAGGGYTSPQPQGGTDSRGVASQSGVEQESNYGEYGFLEPAVKDASDSLKPIMDDTVKTLQPIMSTALEQSIIHGLGWLGQVGKAKSKKQSVGQMEQKIRDGFGQAHKEEAEKVINFQRAVVNMAKAIAKEGQGSLIHPERVKEEFIKSMPTLTAAQKKKIRAVHTTLSKEHIKEKEQEKLQSQQQKLQELSEKRQIQQQREQIEALRRTHHLPRPLRHPRRERRAPLTRRARLKRRRHGHGQHRGRAPPL